MPVTSEENARYWEFVTGVANELGCLIGPANNTVWHYTDGQGFLGILQSSKIYATQVSALNDSNETKYAQDLFKNALRQVIEDREGDATALALLRRVLEELKEEPDNPTHGTSKFFVTCFSAEEDDLAQWDRYGKENAYAIGFHTIGLIREPNSAIYRVVYDRERQERAAKKLAEATLWFYRDGLHGDRKEDPDTWFSDFFEVWDGWIYKLAPLAKDASWRAESEYRVVHELQASDLDVVQFAQKRTMLARYLALDFPKAAIGGKPGLPIAKVMIGPGNHPAFTRVSTLLLLERMGYTNVPVEITKVSLTRP
jgi:hypothetical protein